jgi:tRNA G18 (ribose-2'-O)-methylase SpoU
MYTIVLENIRSAWNVGSIMRTCDALGCNLVFVGYTPRPEGKTLAMVKKTSIGAENTVHWEYYQHPQEVFSVYPDKEHYGIEINNKSRDIIEYSKSHLPQSGSLLWFGNEISGLSELVEGEVKELLHLPMKGSKESLNVATSVTATGYILASLS